MDTRSLEIFVTAAKLCSFSAAARALDLDPSAVSRSISVLERELGVRLFQRSTRHIALTDAGTRYLARIAPVLEELRAARQEAADGTAGVSGRVRISCSVAFGEAVLVPLVPALRAAHPALALDLVLSDAVLDPVRDRIDLAIRLAPEVTGDLVAARLMSTRYHVVAAPGIARPGSPQDLAGRDVLRLDLPGYRDSWRFRDPTGAETEVPVTGPILASSVGALRALARAGQGPALLADWMLRDDLAAGRLIDLFPDHRATATGFDTGAWLVYPSRSFLPAGVRAVIRHLRAAVADLR